MARNRAAAACAEALVALAMPTLLAQQPVADPSAAAKIAGTVVGADNRPVAGASVTLRQSAGSGNAVERTDERGAFAFSALLAGAYRIAAEKSGRHSLDATVSVSASGLQVIQLTLLPPSSGSGAASSGAMRFADQPNFTVAGVTDWTAVGGHGSDAVLRTSEELARGAAALKSGGPPPTAADSPSASTLAADEHRRAGEAAEKAGDPLSAVRDYEQAARLDPSERNYFAWGSELLTHRAVWQAVEVFESGSKAYPSARMLAALGAALFAGARYDDAALRLCEASDLNPAAAEPYIFLGKIAIAAPEPLPCVEQRLAGFQKRRPDSSPANYFYAMALLKAPQPPAPQQVQALLTRATVLDPKCADAWLQLGIQAYSSRDIQGAVAFYAKAIEANPEFAEAHYRLGAAYDRSGDAAAAKREFQLHDEIARREAAKVEQERRAVKQFLIVLEGQHAAQRAP